jgi:hypothetical protein
MAESLQPVFDAVRERMLRSGGGMIVAGQGGYARQLEMMDAA